MYARTIIIKERRERGEGKGRDGGRGEDEGVEKREALQTALSTEMKLPGEFQGRRLPRDPLPTSTSPSQL